MTFQRLEVHVVPKQYKITSHLTYILLIINLTSCITLLGQTTKNTSSQYHLPTHFEQRESEVCINSDSRFFLSNVPPKQTIPQNKQNSSREIWSKFLFGSGQRYTKPRFVFSSVNAPKNLPFKNISQVEQTRRQEREHVSSNRLGSKKSGLVSENSVAVDELSQVVKQRRQKIEELDRYLASPNKFRLNNPSNTITDPVRNDSKNVQTEPRSNSFAMSKDYSNKIRQVNAEEKDTNKDYSLSNNLQGQGKIRSYEEHSETSTFPPFNTNAPQNESRYIETIPVKPKALKLSDRSYISAEIVKLPKSGNLTQSTKNSTNLPSRSNKIPSVSSKISQEEASFVSPRFLQQSN